jgi:ankyrin repeat protein
MYWFFKCNRNGISPLFIAAQEGYFGIVCKLLENKADINKSQDDGATPLLIACHRGHTRIVKHLVQNKANVNKSLQIGYSPLPRYVFRKFTLALLSSKYLTILWCPFRIAT